MCTSCGIRGCYPNARWREPMPTCIYCGFSSPEKFPREHVIPQAFGAFQNNLTLGCVCADCNCYFGKHLELRFATESAESIVRYRHGLRDIESAERTRTVRARANIPGPIQGAKVLLRPDSSAKSGIENVYVAQVGIQNTNDAEPRWYTLQELDSGVMQTLEPGARITYFFTSPEQEQKLRSRLRDLGLGPTEVIGRNTVLPNKNFNTRVVCDFDFNMSRCVAKIAFNYLAHVLGENTDVLLRTDFDGVRKYVREGISPGYPVLSLSSKPNFNQDAGRPPFVNGHILAVGSDHATGRITCAISLFNAMSYLVLVCRKYEGLWFALWSAHAFDFDSGEVRPLPVNLYARPVLI